MTSFAVFQVDHHQDADSNVLGVPGPKPGSAYQQLFVKNRNIAARTPYGLYMDPKEAMTPEAIAADYDLPIAAVYEAIAYCESDPPEIRQDWEADEALAEVAGMNDPDHKYHPSPWRLTPQERSQQHQTEAVAGFEAIIRLTGNWGPG